MPFCGSYKGSTGNIPSGIHHIYENGVTYGSCAWNSSHIWHMFSNLETIQVIIVCNNILIELAQSYGDLKSTQHYSESDMKELYTLLTYKRYVNFQNFAEYL